MRAVHDGGGCGVFAHTSRLGEQAYFSLDGRRGLPGNFCGQCGHCEARHPIDREKDGSMRRAPSSVDVCHRLAVILQYGCVVTRHRVALRLSASY